MGWKERDRVSLRREIVRLARMSHEHRLLGRLRPRTPAQSACFSSFSVGSIGLAVVLLQG